MNNALHAFLQNFVTRIFLTFFSAVGNILIPDHNADAFKLDRQKQYIGDYVIGQFIYA